MPRAVCSLSAIASKVERFIAQAAVNALLTASWRDGMKMLSDGKNMLICRLGSDTVERDGAVNLEGIWANMLKQWNEMKAADFAGPIDGKVFILPVAATEQHGPHLPTGTDAFILDGILRAAMRAAGPLRGIVLPMQPIGWSVEHGGLPGTLSFDAELLTAAWVGLGHWIARAGARRLLILNSHGGNSPAVSLAAMRLRAERGLFVVKTHWEALAHADELAPAGAPAPDWHAGWIETSLMLHLRPDLVAMDRAAAGAFRHPEGLPPNGPAPWAWMTADLSANGVIGDPRMASGALGARLVERAVIGLAALLDDMAAAVWPRAGDGGGEKP